MFHCHWDRRVLAKRSILQGNVLPLKANPRAFVQSALYTLINTRLTADKRTVISSNLTMDQVRARYTPQIASRLEGEYRVLPFYGEDIRLLRKQRL